MSTILSLTLPLLEWQVSDSPSAFPLETIPGSSWAVKHIAQVSSTSSYHGAGAGRAADILFTKANWAPDDQRTPPSV
jgi:hypothetical protein